MTSQAMAPRSSDGWELRYDGWDPDEQPLREALTTLANGHFSTRGANEEAQVGGPHYPGTYLAGGYDRLESDVAGRIVENEDLVNWPNWLPLTFRVEQGAWFSLEDAEIVSYRHSLDLLRGILTRSLHFRDGAGREWTLRSRRIVHMGKPYVAAIEWTLTPLDWSGTIELRSAIDGRVTNGGVARYSDFDGHHLELCDRGTSGEDAIFLVSRTRQSHIVMAQAVRTRVSSGGEPAAAARRTETHERLIAHHLTLSCAARKPIRVEKVVVLQTSLDFAISEPRLQACTQIHRLPCFDALLEDHERSWGRLWSRADIALNGDHPYSQLALRLHIFHMLQTASIHTIDRDVGVPARGLHGEAYRGHVFWDELFVLPFFNLRLPVLARSLLMYRYRRMDEARHAASEAGYRGAMFPWQSGSDGREESQRVHLNPRSGRWLPDETFRQRHVGAAIAYNVWQYYQATGDTDFLSSHGAEMLLEIARFFASIATYDSRRARYGIEGVVGPDEFHTRYPGSERPGIDNNAYTNVMAVWVLQTALSVLEILADSRRRELLATLHIEDEELHHFDEISRRMFVPFHEDGIISQFEGWDALAELDWQGLRERHGDIHRLDRVLEAEGDDPNRYKATKQADVLMLFFLLSAEELCALLARLGYQLDPQAIPRTVQYYLERTTHGSTLSRVVHAWVLARSDRPASYELFHDALASDICDVQGGTTPEGIHSGAMGGTVDLMQRCYTGIEMRDDILWLNPQLPKKLEGLKVWLRYRGHWLSLEITADAVTVAFAQGGPAPARICFADEIYDMPEGTERTFELQPAAEQVAAQAPCGDVRRLAPSAPGGGRAARRQPARQP